MSNRAVVDLLGVRISVDIQGTCKVSAEDPARRVDVGFTQVKKKKQYLETASAAILKHPDSDPWGFPGTHNHWSTALPDYPADVDQRG